LNQQIEDSKMACNSTLQSAVVVWMCLVAQAANATLALPAAACTDRNSCNGHGNCVNMDNCVCDPGWGGDTCADPVPTPPPTPAVFCHNRTDCAGHGNCRNGAACTCDAGWNGDTCAVAVPTPPPTPSPGVREKVRESLLYLVLVVLPFLCRVVQGKIMDTLKAWCCERAFGGDAFKEALVGSSKGSDADVLNAFRIAGFRGKGEIEDEMSWDQAVAVQGWSRRMGVAVSVLRLVFWHWLQPAMYVTSLYAYWDQIDDMQQKLGLVVAAREALYPLLTLVALWRRPIFLLANLSSPEWRVQSYLLYVFMPEKFAARCAFDDGYVVRGLLPCLFAGCDLCGTAALIVGAAKGTLPAALAVGYSVATLGWMAGAVLMVIW
jgi:hypothetical protein